MPANISSYTVHMYHYLCSLDVDCFSTNAVDGGGTEAHMTPLFDLMVGVAIILMIFKQFYLLLTLHDGLLAFTEREHTPVKKTSIKLDA